MLIFMLKKLSSVFQLFHAWLYDSKYKFLYTIIIRLIQARNLGLANVKLFIFLKAYSLFITSSV